ncbi:hypothetical protein BCR36DRAFT_580362 [Piromyces finnis]|uniref:Uncharacterized protein n=1 Tax=Piromyces finnis TaxID=1754191 RepID=A0A1Y1VKA4_9FUNG|nr:hypothetical protein BCR36DRAFT_580362 [Piromyces finnis]|eukprot:ORX57797.1 hypothetical protein BCR36DRAFT_580362 [Piromyces finnis]
MKSSILAILCLSFVGMVYSNDVFEPTEIFEIIEPTGTSMEGAEPTESALDNYFSCEIDDWECKAEMAKKCFDDASQCDFDAEVIPQECINILTACERIWNY